MPPRAQTVPLELSVLRLHLLVVAARVASILQLVHQAVYLVQLANLFQVLPARVNLV
jgi:hypothetical protein